MVEYICIIFHRTHKDRTDCRSLKSQKIAFQVCDGRETCNVKPSVAGLSKQCKKNTYKYYEVQYACIDDFGTCTRKYHHFIIVLIIGNHE